MTPAPQRLVNQVVIGICRFTLVAAALLAIPVWRSLDEPWVMGAMVVFMVPAILATVFPFSVVAAVDTIRKSGLPPHVERAFVARLAVAALVLMIVFAGWVAPRGNQAWRVATAPPGKAVVTLDRAIRELTTYQLIVDPDRVYADWSFPEGYRERLVRRELTGRVTLSLLPVVFIWLRWAALGTPRRRWFLPQPGSVATVIVIVGYALLWLVGASIELRQMLPYSLGLWTPIAGFIVVGMLMQAWSRGLRT